MLASNETWDPNRHAGWHPSPFMPQAPWPKEAQGPSYKPEDAPAPPTQRTQAAAEFDVPAQVPLKTNGERSRCYFCRTKHAQTHLGRTPDSPGVPACAQCAERFGRKS